ncbi:hypothetical protein HYC85_010406 [Camellia sinensis]|uniref:BZIP domain-containing protein n=1 Tax=Camellia sinensis TaxID=4442 RepID=A0A7J7HHT0_CAMSI|nr:hypothetical protein HYC85_010406 [Camellia sinensis]
MLHTHTQVFPSGEDDDPPQGEDHLVPKPRRASGNREAVRKYREKKKAHTAYLEEEVKKLRLLNQQLIRKLQGQAILESEILRLRGLLLDLRGKIDEELGVFPFQNKCDATATFKEGECGVQSNGTAMALQCENDVPCFHPHLDIPMQGGSVVGNGKMAVSWEENCQPAIIDCQANTNGVVSANGCPIDAVETLVSSASQAEQLNEKDTIAFVDYRIIVCYIMRQIMRHEVIAKFMEDDEINNFQASIVY